MAVSSLQDNRCRAAAYSWHGLPGTTAACCVITYLGMSLNSDINAVGSSLCACLAELPLHKRVSMAGKGHALHESKMLCTANVHAFKTSHVGEQTAPSAPVSHRAHLEKVRALAQTYIVLLTMQMMSWVTTLALQILLPMTVVGCAICKSSCCFASCSNS